MLYCCTIYTIVEGKVSRINPFTKGKILGSQGKLSFELIDSDSVLTFFFTFLNKDQFYWNIWKSYSEQNAAFHGEGGEGLKGK